jgi:site-specific DNA-methyltransferase (adenine-specific)
MIIQDIEVSLNPPFLKTAVGGSCGSLTISNEDNMLLMARYPDNYFDLAIVDPPYGIDIHKMNYTQSTKGGITKRNDYSGITDWDSNVPTQEYFTELFRVSKNQIIWGGNYFDLPLTKSWIIWDKKTEEKYSNDFADCEMAWNSFNKPAKVVRYLWSGMLQPNMKNKQKRIHPTEKPFQLYKWILDKYAKQGDKILDTHLGSGSIAIACYDYGFDLTACELDKEYFESAIKRIENHTNQQKLF